MTESSATEPTEWALNIRARLRSGISVPITEVNAMLEAAGEEPIPPMTPAEAEAELCRMYGCTPAELYERIARSRGRRQS